MTHQTATRAAMAALALGLGLAATARADDPPPFEPGEELHLNVRYLGMNAGDINISVGRTEQDGVETWPLEMHAKTRGIVGAMYGVDEKFVSHFDPQTNRSLGYDLDAVYDGEPHQERVRYAGTSAHVKQVRRTGTKEEDKDILPGAMDVLAAIYRLRSEPLDGSEIRVPIFTGRKTWELVGKVIGREKVETQAGTFDTLIVRCRTHFDGKFASDRDLTVWLSNDAHRVPVKLEADFMVGSMKGSLVDYRSGTLAENERRRR